MQHAEILFAKIPNQIVYSHVQETVKVVYTYIVYKKHEYGTINPTPSYKKICKDLHITQSTAYRAIKTLIEYGWITVTRRFHKNMVIEIVPLPFKGFHKMPVDILLSDMSAVEKMYFTILYNGCDKSGDRIGTLMSHRRAANILGKSERSVKRYFADLEKRGFVSKILRSDGLSSIKLINTAQLIYPLCLRREDFKEPEIPAVVETPEKIKVSDAPVTKIDVWQEPSVEVFSEIEASIQFFRLTGRTLIDQYRRLGLKVKRIYIREKGTEVIT